MKRKSVLVSALMILFCVSVSFAQSGYLKIDDIIGESTASGHEDWIVIESMSQGLEQQQRTAGATRSRASVGVKDLIISKKLDKASPKLMKACANGKVIPKLELELTRSNGQTYYKVTLERVRVSSIQTHSSGDSSETPVEEVAFNYTKITWEYTSSDGSTTTATYDVQRGN